MGNADSPTIKEPARMKIIRTTQSRISEVDFSNLGFGNRISDHTFEVVYKDGAWGKGIIQPYGPMRHGLGLHALHYGQAVFEGMKAYRQGNGRVAVFRPEANWARLNRSGSRLLIPELPKEIFMESLFELLRVDQAWVPKEEEQALYIRPFLFGSSEFITARPSEEYTFGIVTGPVGAYYSKPVKVKVEDTYTRAASGGVGYTKAAGNYGGAFYASAQAQKEGFNQVLWTDHREHTYLEEAGTMNVAFVINDVLVTPALTDRILAGITRDSILTLCRHWGVAVEERLISVHELEEASANGSLQEAFGMGTAAVVSPIDGIGYKGNLLSVPAPLDGLAMRVKKGLADIRFGRSEDLFGWMQPID